MSAIAPRAGRLASALLLAGSVAHAAWPTNGVRVSPVPPDLGPDVTQQYRLIGAASDGAGGATLVWVHAVSPASYPSTIYDLSAQHLDAAGERLPGWPASGLTAVTWDPLASSSPASVAAVGVLEAAAGGAHLTNVEYGNVGGENAYRLAIHHFAATGTVARLGGLPLGPVSAVRAATSEDGAGGVLSIGRTDPHAPPPGPSPDPVLLASRVNAPVGDVQWAVELAPPGMDAGPVAVTSDGAGGGWFAWADNRDTVGGGPDPDLVLHHVRADGVPDPLLPAGGLLVCGAAGEPRALRLAGDGAGGVYVAWEDWRTGTQKPYIACVRADGTPAAGSPQDGRALTSGGVATAEYLLDLEADGAGGVYVASAFLVGKMFLRHLGPDGLASAGWPANGVTLAHDPVAPAVAAVVADEAHGAFAIYLEAVASPSPHMAVSARRLAPDGQAAAGWDTLGYVLSDTVEYVPSVALVRSGTGAIASWSDARHGGSVYAQRLDASGPPPVAGAPPGATMPALGLAPPQPNPGTGPVRFGIALPREDRVDVRIFDASGRCVRVLLHGWRPAGASSIVWDARDDRGRRVPAGLYWARLASGTCSVSRKLAIVH